MSSSVVPRMVVADPAGALEFLRTVFGAEGELEGDRPVDVTLGDARLMISRIGEREPFPVFLYVYVRDVDATYDRALTAAATSVEPPGDTFYGDRRATVRDPFGNLFQIACRRS